MIGPSSESHVGRSPCLSIQPCTTCLVLRIDRTEDPGEDLVREPVVHLQFQPGAAGAELRERKLAQVLPGNP